MSRKSQPLKAVTRKFQRIGKRCLSAINRQIIWLLRTIFNSNRRRDNSSAGFVLPTVVMVSVVVILLTAAILFRSFDRAKNASNVRVNTVVLNAATPALERARAKLNALFEDPTLPRGTPSDSALYNALVDDKYKLDDEDKLTIAFDVDGDGSIDDPEPAAPTPTPALEDTEVLKTAWKFAVDTDNNGKKDTFTLYGIYFRSPTRNETTGKFDRARNPLEARTPPMDDALTNSACGSATGFAALVGNSSWYKLSSGNLGKSFFIYTVNVPITSLGNLNTSQYELYRGNKGVVALEYQQDRIRVPLPNNAVWFENDLEVLVGSTDLSVNGRVHTNGNLLAGSVGAGTIRFRQVSSTSSCFYNQENGIITVGGNVGNGSPSQLGTSDTVIVDLYQGFGKTVTSAKINGTNKSTDQDGGNEIGFNDNAYNQRIRKMREEGLAACSSCASATTTSGLISAVDSSGYPEEIKGNFENKVKSTDDFTTAKNTLLDLIEVYLRNRTRRVPFAEIAASATEADAISGFTSITESLEPPDDWQEPINSSNQFTNATTVSLTATQLEATYPTLQNQEGVQTLLGDRVLVGNNLPAVAEPEPVSDGGGGTVNWTRPTTSPQTRERESRVEAVTDLGVFDRNGFWEESAATAPVTELDGVGGVRIITGAGIYVDGSGPENATTGPFYSRDHNGITAVTPDQRKSFLSSPPDPTPADPTDNIPVWTDTMPMSRPGDPVTGPKGDLLMRATAVYHYISSSGVDQTPIACVSSYYDPSTPETAQNKSSLPFNAGTNGRSNNGIVYNFPGRGTFDRAVLQRQANLVFPNGRWANQPLRDALSKFSGNSVPAAGNGLQLADYSAIDTALCAIAILNDEASFATPSNQPPHGAIKEAAFLDGREIRQDSADSTTSNYDLDLEQRQPSEVRVTEIDLGQLASTSVSTDYLLPYSGIIYASREDALRDDSARIVSGVSSDDSKLLSPTDYILDPTRRPNGIRLINGATLARDPATNNNAYDPKEKGLILVTDLPAYIKGNFNQHRSSTTSTAAEIEEFTALATNSNFYTRSVRNNNFACRPNRPGCGTTNTDFWRSATIIADAMTLLSNDFIDGFRSEADYELNNNTLITIPATINNPLPSNLDPATDPRIKRLKNGFWENGFVTNADWFQASGTADEYYPQTTTGSYLRNGVTPIQKRADAFPVYVMEICRKLPVSECGPDDWYVGFDINGNNNLDDTIGFDGNGDGFFDTNDTEKTIKANKLGQAIIAAYGSNIAGADNILQNTELSWTTQFTTGSISKSIVERLGAGDTATPALQPADRRYPRRVAFARYNAGVPVPGTNPVRNSVKNELVATNTTAPLLYRPLGRGCPLDTTGTNYRNNGCTYSGTTAGTHYGQTADGALWFRNVNSTSNPSDMAQVRYSTNRLFYYQPIDGPDTDTDPDLDGQPLLVPVLQIHDARTSHTATRTDITEQDIFRTKWMQRATTATTFNATYVLGNSPSRASELSAGLQNFVRFLESWDESTTTPRAAKISGSFIQLKRSSYATGPFAPIQQDRAFNTNGFTAATATNNLSLFDYALDTYPTPNSRVLPYYSPPTRAWGFDVGLLSEQPDLFAQRFTAPPGGRPNEFYREVGRDDPWVSSLLCAVQGTSGSYSNAVPTEFRPSNCPSSIP